MGATVTVSRDFFHEIGTFDDGMELWGGENIDMSIRVRNRQLSITTDTCRSRQTAVIHNRHLSITTDTCQSITHLFTKNVSLSIKCTPAYKKHRAVNQMYTPVSQNLCWLP